VCVCVCVCVCKLCEWRYMYAHKRYLHWSEGGDAYKLAPLSNMEVCVRTKVYLYMCMCVSIIYVCMCVSCVMRAY
jgi:hypothetical protein